MKGVKVEYSSSTLMSGPGIDKAESNRQAYNNLADTHSKRSSSYQVMRRQYDELNALVRSSMPDKDVYRVLDVGCGTGRDVAHFNTSTEVKYSAIGIDFAENMIKHARSMYPSYEFKVMDMTGLEFGNDSFDVAWAVGSMHHIGAKEAKDVLEQLNRILVRNGVLYTSWAYGTGEGMRIEKDGSRRYYNYHTETALRRITEEAGFKVVEMYKSPNMSAAAVEESLEWLNMFAVNVRK